MTIGRNHIIQLLNAKKCKKFGQYLGREIWVTPPPDNLVIRLPLTGAIHIDLVEIICLEIFNMGMWEYDYWLGQIGYNN